MPSASRRMRRAVRLLSTLLIAGGALLLIWVVVVWQWQDPFTAIYTHFEQARLSRDYNKRVAAFRPKLTPAPSAHRDLAAVEREIAAEAAHTDGPCIPATRSAASKSAASGSRWSSSRARTSRR